jgi:putative oxygen-independent coproporphyrinogen III oxidase
MSNTIRASDPSLADAAAGWKSAYVHIPFCRRRCPYCDFAIVDESTESPSSHDAYVNAVITEIAMEDPFGPLDAVNFGGGTPSRLDPDQIGNLVRALDTRFGIKNSAEISIEVNPEDWTDAYGAGLAFAGVNRVSLGAQSVDAELLGVLGRLHTHEQTVAAVAGARSAGMRSVSVDMIFGHPAESDASWEMTVAAVVELPIDHISSYALTVEPGTALSRDVNDGATPPDDDVQADRYIAFSEAAAAAGFDRYEVSNHARPDHVCRYNLATWANAEYLGFGLGAHDHRVGIRSRNHRRIDRYMAAVDEGVRPRLGSEWLDAEAEERDALMLGMRLAAGTPTTPSARAFAASSEGGRFIEAGVVVVDADRLTVTNPLLADAVAREALSVTATKH